MSPLILCQVKVTKTKTRAGQSAQDKEAIRRTMKHPLCVETSKSLGAIYTRMVDGTKEILTISKGKKRNKLEGTRNAEKGTTG